MREGEDTPPPFWFSGVAKLPHRFADGGLKLEFRSLEELSRRAVAAVSLWEGIPCAVAVVAPETIERLVPLLEVEDGEESEGPRFLPEPKEEKQESREQSPSQMVFFKIRGFIIDSEPDRQTVEAFYRWVVLNWILPELSRKKEEILEDWEIYRKEGQSV